VDVTVFELAVAERPATAWRTAGVFLGCCLPVVVLVYWSTVASIVRDWSADPFAHGYFVLPAVVCLAWTRRNQLRTVTPVAAFAALPIVAALSLLWLLAAVADVHIVQQFAVVALCVGVTWAIAGTAAIRALVFPIGLLLFALPVGDWIAAPLQNVTALAAAKMLRYSIAVTLDRQFISTATTRWHVSEACGGIHYFIACLAVGYVYAGTVYRRWSNRAAFLVAAAAIPVAGNAIRVYTTILLAESGATAVVAGMGHYLYGLLVFTIMMVVLFVTCGRWREDADVQPDSRASRLGATARPVSRTAWCAALAMAIVMTGPSYANAFMARGVAAGFIAPAVSGPWMPGDDDPIPISLDAAAAGSDIVQTYRSAGEVVTINVTSCDASVGAATLISKTPSEEEQAWSTDDVRRRTVEISGEPLIVNEASLRTPSTSARLWTWYDVEGTRTENRHMAKLLRAKARLAGNLRSCSLFSVATWERPGSDAAGVLADFVAHLAPLHTGVPAGGEPTR
jgi:exosortase A